MTVKNKITRENDPRDGGNGSKKGEEVGEKEKGGCLCCRSSCKRYVALIYILATTFFYSVIFDMPGSMQTVAEKTFSISTYEYEYLYSVYLLPNIVMCFFGGLLMDKVCGLFWGSLLFGGIALTGQVVQTVGGFTRSYGLMLIGRFVSGVGAESVSLSLCCFIVAWFRGKGLSFVFGLSTSVSRLGSSFAFLVFTPIYNYFETLAPENLVFGFTVLVYLLIAVAMMVSLTSLCYYSRINHRLDSKDGYFESSIRFKDILDFPFIYWIVLIMFSVCYNAFYGFTSISQQLLETKYGLTQGNADYLSSEFNLISALACSFPGVIVDLVGWDLFFNLSGMIAGVLSQAIMTLSSSYPLLPLILYAVFFALLNSCTWPLVSSLVKPYQLATAYGTFQCFINIVGTANNILVGFVLEEYGPDGVSLLFLTCITLGAVCCSLIWFLDKKSNGILNISAARRRQIMKIHSTIAYQ